MDSSQIVKELQFKAVRSSGAGGQHVNKVSTKVELVFDIINSSALSEDEKARILKKLSSKLTKEGSLLLHSDSTRSQHKNKELAIKRFLEIIREALKVPKKRKKTKPSKGAIEKGSKQKRKLLPKKTAVKSPVWNRKPPSKPTAVFNKPTQTMPSNYHYKTLDFFLYSS